MTKRHPLQTYLNRIGLKAYKFAPKAKISVHQLYEILAGRAEGKSTTLANISSATKGEVTAQEMADWYLARKKEKARVEYSRSRSQLESA